MPNSQLPMTTVFDFTKVGEIIEAAASAMSTQLSVSSGWEDDDSWQNKLISGLETLNPVSGLYNLAKHGQWQSVTGGAQKVGIDSSRRAQLHATFVRDFTRLFYQRLCGLPNGPVEALAYLNSLVDRTRLAWDAISEQFEFARQVNKQVSVALNDALDRAYRIRTAASIAFMVVGSLPVATAAAGAATAGSFTLAASSATGTLIASSSAWWAVMLQVAGASAVYGFLTELAFNPNDVKRSSAAAGTHGNEAATAGAVGFGGNVAQTAVERVRASSAQALADQARLEANRAAVANAVRSSMSEALNGRPAPVRMLNNEIQRACSQRLAEHAERNLSRTATRVARSGSVLFIAAGLYMMRDEIRTALDGLTTGIDRTR